MTKKLHTYGVQIDTFKGWATLMYTDDKYDAREFAEVLAGVDARAGRVKVRITRDGLVHKTL